MKEKQQRDKKFVKNKDLVKGLEKLLEMSREGKIENLLLAACLQGGEVITATFNLDIKEQHVLMSYLNVNLTVRTIEEEY